MEDIQMTEDHDNHNNDQDEEEEDSSTRCPRFTSSDKFQFMMVKEYERREVIRNAVTESEYSFAFVRPMDAVLGVLENPHGSVRLMQGSTTVIAAVYGPSDVRMSKELPHRAAVDVLFRPKVTGSGNTSSMIAAGIMDPITEERAMEQTITSVLEAVIHLEDHLQAGFNVIIHEVEDHGCLLSTCVNAAALALLNAGCSLRCLFAAVTFCVCGDSIVVDPSLEQIESLKKRSSSTSTPYSLTTFVITNDTDKRTHTPQILHVSSFGSISAPMLSRVYKLVTTTDICYEIFGFFSRTISSDLGGICGVSEGACERGVLKTEDLKGEEMEEEGELIDDSDE